MMSSISKKANFPYRWFRWVPVVMLFLAALMPAGLMTIGYITAENKANFQWQWGHYGISLLLMIVPATALAFPIIGGILGLLVSPAVPFGYGISASFSSGLSEEGATFFLFYFFWFAGASLLLIIYGIARWWRRKQKKRIETPVKNGN